MKLLVQLLEARNLKPGDRPCQAYAVLKLGNTKRKSSISPNGAENPYWFEDFSFDVVDLGAELSISVWSLDRLSDEFHGRFRLPVAIVLSAERQAISSWYPLQKRGIKSKTPTTGEVRVSFSLLARSPSFPRTFLGHQLSDESSSSSVTSSSEHSYLFQNGSSVSVQPGNTTDLHDATSSDKPSSSFVSFLYFIAAWFLGKVRWFLPNLVVAWLSRRGIQLHPNTNKVETDIVESLEEAAEILFTGDEGSDLLSFFEDDGISVSSSQEDMPIPLGRGVLLSDTYLVSAKALNKILFGPESQFLNDFNELQKTTNLIEKPWIKGEDSLPKRVITYIKAATKLVSSVKATEEQKYSRVDEKGFVVDVTAITLDAPYGSTFRVNLQYCIFAGSNTRTGEKTSLLRVSWDLQFVTSTIMKGLIEKGARQGLQESYKQYAQVLEKYAKPHQESSLAGVQNEEPIQQNGVDVDALTPRSDWQLARENFCSVRVCITLLSIFLVLAHIYRRSCSKSGLEVWKLDLPDTLCELILSALLGAQVQSVIGMARNFLKARLHRGPDYGAGVKGNGWVLAVTLVEAQNLPAFSEDKVPDPYVVFTCVGRTLTSSVKLRCSSPEWEESFEFEPMEEAPSTMRVDVFDFEGPFTEAESVGHSEINFLKQKPEELADLWVPLQKKNGSVLGSKVRLRIVLATTKEAHNAVHYIEKVEKEVGLKITRRNFVKNASFQKLFALPSEEFLVNNFSCSLKRKFLVQGRVFLSPRVLAFYSNIFGHKTRFVILWEDIEEIKELSPSLGSMGGLLNPTMLVFTKKGRATDAQHGAKSVDAKGRFKFQFQAFIHYKLAFRTVKALWKYRTFSLEKRMEMIADIEQNDDALEPVYGQSDTSGTFLGVEEANLEEVYSTELPLSVNCMSQMFEQDHLDEKIAEKAGWLEYCPTPWEFMAEDGVQQRQISFKLSKQISLFETNVTCIQQKTRQNDGHICYLDEVLTLHDVPFGDYFQIRVRKEIEDVSLSPPASSCKILVGVAWQKSTTLQCSISNNIFQRFTKHLKDIIDISVREILELSNESCGT